MVGAAVAIFANTETYMTYRVRGIMLISSKLASKRFCSNEGQDRNPWLQLYNLRHCTHSLIMLAHNYNQYIFSSISPSDPSSMKISHLTRWWLHIARHMTVVGSDD
jgi:hypothetical protein